MQRGCRGVGIGSAACDTWGCSMQHIGVQARLNADRRAVVRSAAVGVEVLQPVEVGTAQAGARSARDRRRRHHAAELARGYGRSPLARHLYSRAVKRGGAPLWRKRRLHATHVCVPGGGDGGGGGSGGRITKAEHEAYGVVGVVRGGKGW